MSVYKVEAAGIMELGEGPHWNVATESLYYVDIFGKSIHKYTPSTNEHCKADIGNHVTLIVPIHGNKNKYIISINRSLSVIEWDGTLNKLIDVNTIAEVDTDTAVIANRINDGKCDPYGRLWFGTMGVEPVNGQIAPNMGGFYNLQYDKTIKQHIKNVHISNGLCWSIDGSKFYYIDSGKKVVDEYDFNGDLSTICKSSNAKIIFSLQKHNIEGFCDGMTIDSDGNLWIAIFNGYRVIKIDPRNPETLLQTVMIPAKQVTSVAFGGKHLDELYVTTAKFTVDDEVLNAPEHGSLYKIVGLGVKGLPAVNCKI